MLAADPRCLIYPIDVAVVDRAPATLEIHDALIVGTALVQSEPVMAILTYDQAITNSGLVPVVW